MTLGTGLELPRNAVPLESRALRRLARRREIAFVSDSDTKLNETNYDVYTIEIGAKTAENRTADNEAARRAAALQPGRSLARVRGQQRSRASTPTSGARCSLDRASGAVRTVAEAWDRSADGLVWGPDGKRLFGADRRRRDRRASTSSRSTVRRARSRASRASRSGRVEDDGTLVGLRQSFLEPPTLVQIDPESGDATKLSKVNDALLAGTDLGTYESVTYAGASGDPIQMWVNYPPGFDKSKKYPLFLLIHGGPHNGDHERHGSSAGTRRCSAAGATSPAGRTSTARAASATRSPTRSTRSRTSSVRGRDQGRGLVRAAAVDRSREDGRGRRELRRLPDLDHPRAASTRSKRSSRTPRVYNWYTQPAADYGVEVRRFGGCGCPIRRRCSAPAPRTSAPANFNTPTLVVHGELDFRVPFNHGLELYQTLVQRGVPTRLLYFPDENHWVLKPQNSLLWYSRSAEVDRRWALGIKPAASQPANGR